jgi:hypothetical protein
MFLLPIGSKNGLQFLTLLYIEPQGGTFGELPRLRGYIAVLLEYASRQGQTYASSIAINSGGAAASVEIWPHMADHDVMYRPVSVTMTVFMTAFMA